MKKIICFLLILSLGFLFGCKKEETPKENYEQIKIIVPSGTPLVAVGGLLGSSDYQFDVVTGADLLTTALAKGEYDVVIAPVTAATKLSILGKSQYKFASIITTGNNYLVSKGGSSNIEDLNGKKILAYGQNNTPDIALKSALESHNITCEIEYQSAVSDVVPFIVGENNDYDYFLTAEPTLTQLKQKYNLDLTIIDLQEALKSEMDMIPQAGIFVLEKENNQKELEHFLKEVKDNIDFLNNNGDKYYEKVGNLNEFFQKLGEEVLEESLKTSNIAYYSAKDNKATMNKYYDLLNKYNNSLLNGLTPSEEFYY